MIVVLLNFKTNTDTVPIATADTLPTTTLLGIDRIRGRYRLDPRHRDLLCSADGWRIIGAVRCVSCLGRNSSRGNAV